MPPSKRCKEGVRLAREISNVALIAALLNDLGNVFTSQSKYLTSPLCKFS